MRKYFLLSAIALLAASNTNAATDYANIELTAKVEHANTLTCTPLNFGTIVLSSNEAGEVQFNTYTESAGPSGSVLSVTGKSGGTCKSNIELESAGWSYEIENYLSRIDDDIGADSLMLFAQPTILEDKKTLYLEGTLTVFEGFSDGDYIGSMTLTYVR